MTVTLRDGTKIEAVANIRPHLLGDIVMLFLKDSEGWHKGLPEASEVAKIEA